MAKMGWTSGRGLGSNEHGIVDPVSGGEIRDRNEQFMGLGRTLDPYEQFRKQRSGTYHDRGAFHRK
ncbi:CBN-TAG-65 protein [Caenorhabditis brenneri]|uniref:CBN-TAG-65 protein n=1 Tax=Caenorhabditis brenneri TaxID=135651 RepID=G0MRX9_CAEBE|nr:CBN-TAG-65 protein [Caenorhabditis brenneri]